MKRNKEFGKFILSMLLFGSNGVVASFIALSSREIVLTRTIQGTILLMVLFLGLGNHFTYQKHKKDYLYIALSGIMMAANWLLLFEAYAQVGVSLGMLLNYCGPVIVMVLSPLLFHERLTIRKAVAMTAALAGAVMISCNAAFQGVNAAGLVCGLLSAFAYAAMIICNKKSKEVTGFENATMQMVFCMITVVIFQLWRQGLAMHIAPADYLPVLWLGLINTGIGCYLYFSSIGKLPVQTVAICGYLEPVSAILLSFVILHEEMGLLRIFGAILIIAGAVLGEWKPTKTVQKS